MREPLPVRTLGAGGASNRAYERRFDREVSQFAASPGLEARPVVPDDVLEAVQAGPGHLPIVPADVVAMESDG
jgi:hypothetical protein